MLSDLATVPQDVRYALRGLVRSPVFALTAILTAALGIGATTAVFSAVDRILFRPLPYLNEERLVSTGMMTPLDRNEFLFAEPYAQLRRNLGPFEEVSAFQAGTIDVDLTENDPVRLRALRIQFNLLRLLGVSPVAGRAFTSEEDRPNGPRMAMISHALWRSRFGGDPGAVGQMLSLDGERVEIVGVLPREFLVPTLTQADVLLPLALNEATERSGRALRVFARLKPGTSVRQASDALQPQFEQALLTVPAQFRKEITLRVRPLRDRQVGDAKAASLVLLGAVVAVLLIACTNIASLLLARSITRQRETAVRAALGASRWRLVRQSLTESLMVSIPGGLLGGVLAWGLLRLVVALSPGALPRLEEASIDGRVLVCVVIATLCSGILFGLAPALRLPASLAMTGWHAAASRSVSRLRPALVVLELGIALVLLTGAGLLLRSLWKLESVSLGLETDRVLVARFVLGRQHYSQTEQQLAFFNELEQRIKTAPGVDTMAITDSIPPSGGSRGRPFASVAVDGRAPLAEGTGGMVGWRYVTPGYFSTLGIPIVRGRPFTEPDRIPGAFAVIVSESLARKLFPNEDPIGKRILRGPQGQWSTVIGVARDVTNLGARRESWPEYYVLRNRTVDYHFGNQEPPTGWRAATVIVRTAIAPNLAATSLRAALRELDPTMPVEIETMRQRVRGLDESPRFYAILLSVFAAVGVLIAAVGLFGVTSFLMAQRTREIGIRMALGATPAVIVRSVLAGTARWIAAGVALGLGGSLAASRLLQSLLFQVEPQDPFTLSVAAAILCAVGLSAAAIPTRRAVRIDPANSLRVD